MATATLRLTCTALPNGRAQVVAQITATEGISDKLFVFKVGDIVDNDVYDRVATPYDIQTYPEARDAQVAFFRASSATLSFSDAGAGNAAKATLVSSITRAVKEYAAVQETFVGVTDTNISS